MAGLSDILTAAKNVVTAINGVAQSYLDVQGIRTAQTLTAATLVSTMGGRVASVSITVAGSGTGAIYDCNFLASPTRQIFTIPNTVGIVVVNLPVTYGIVVVPGTGQTVSVSYS